MARARQDEVEANCRELRADEVVAQAHYEFRLGHVQGNPAQKHPAGTFWYHPHCHGATHNQVAGGMAGFLLVEGEIDRLINQQLTGEEHPDPTVRTGPWDYRERLILTQRVNVQATDPDTPPQDLAPRTDVVIFNAVNGSYEPRIITMRPGAIERWRVLNGSVDGKSYLKFVVLKGRYQYMIDENGVGTLQIVDGNGNATAVPDRATLDATKQQLWLLAWDGVGLVRETGTGGAEYMIKDLNFDAPPNPVKRDFSNIGDCYKDAATILNCYNRPNEVDMAAANRADLFFQAPQLAGDAAAAVYTILGLGTALHADGAPRDDTVIAYIVVRGEAVANSQQPYDFSQLELPPVEPYLLPIQPDELQVVAPHAVPTNLPAQQQHVLQNEIKQYNSVERPQPVAAGQYRTRRVTYAGWGAGDFPQIEVPQEYIDAHPEQAKLRYYTPPAQLTLPGGLTITNLRQPDGSPLPPLLCPPLTRTMSVDGKKFDPMRQDHPQMLWWTAEEWVVTNNSVALWADPNAVPLAYITDETPSFDDEATAIIEELKDIGEDELAASFALLGSLESPPRYWPGHDVAYPVNGATAAANGLKLSTKGADHPFHIHQNPFWLIRIDVPDENGNLVNVLPEPRWSDTVWLPRNGGRVVFRARFPDYLGFYVDHCHILLHEDNGMMQAVETVPTANSANYVPADGVASFAMDADEVDKLYPTASRNLAEAWQSSVAFEDNTPTGQLFPGFAVAPPVLGA